MTKDRHFKKLEDKIRLHIIKCLFNNSAILQNKLTKKFRNEGLIGGVNPSKSISIALGRLEKKGIIQRTSTREKGRPHKIEIIKNHEAMIKTIEEISTLDSYHILNDFKKEFINSEYAQNLINTDLINLIEQKLNEYINTDMIVSFSEDEKRIILNILQASFSAIYYAFFESKMFLWFVIDSDSDIEVIRRLFIEYLILRLGDDTLSRSTNKAKKFNYEIGINFSDIETIPPKLVINGDEVKSNYQHSYEDPDDT